MYKYSLGKQTVECPRCGKRRFKPYVDSQGRMLHPSVGRCNRQNNCSYHLSPSQFFRENPIEAARIERNRGYNPAENLRPDRVAYSRAEPVPPRLSYVDSEIVKASFPGWDEFDASTATRRNPLRSWLLRQFDSATIREVYTLYRLGDANRFGGSTIFWYTDYFWGVRSGKIMAFGEDGHRIKGRSTPICFIHKLLDEPEFNFVRCYWGVHLLPYYPDAKILLVESEKTALYLACLLHERESFPEKYIPVATGGCGNFHIDIQRICDPIAHPGYHGNDIRNRSVVAIPDADAVDQWIEQCAPWRLLNPDFRIIDIRSLAATPSDDIADILIRRRAWKEGGE